MDTIKITLLRATQILLRNDDGWKSGTKAEYLKMTLKHFRWAENRGFIAATEPSKKHFSPLASSDTFTTQQSELTMRV